jgi:hypothetical protein
MSQNACCCPLELIFSRVAAMMLQHHRPSRPELHAAGAG